MIFGHGVSLKHITIAIVNNHHTGFSPIGRYGIIDEDVIVGTYIHVNPFLAVLTHIIPVQFIIA
jgi:hypothetical protein